MNKSQAELKLKVVETLDDSARGNLIEEMKDLCSKLPIYLIVRVDRASTAGLTTPDKAAAKRR